MSQRLLVPPARSQRLPLYASPIQMRACPHSQTSASPYGIFEPHGVAAWPYDGGAEPSVLIADTGNNRILKLTPAGDSWTLSYFAGGTDAGHADGSATSAALFNSPRGIAVCTNNGAPEVMVADTGNHCIRRIRVNTAAALAHGEITATSEWPATVSAAHVVVDTLTGDPGVPGTSDTQTRLEKPTASVLLTSTVPARFALPQGVACFGSGGSVLVGDTYNNRVRQVDTNGVTVTVGGSGLAGLRDGAGTTAELNKPSGLVWSSDKVRAGVQNTS